MGWHKILQKVVLGIVLVGNTACMTARVTPHRSSEPPVISGYFQWPLREVKVTSPYGKRGREFHEGVDLRAPLGTPVYAAQGGKVLYANSGLRGYGKLVVVRHQGRVATLYAHNSKLLVRRGQTVRKGEQIAVSGQTGHSRGAHLHFEIRKNLASMNPVAILPRFTAQRESPLFLTKALP